MLKPQPDNEAASTPRQIEARRRREVAAHIAASRKPQLTRNNGEIDDEAEQFPTNFHKGLPHDKCGFPDRKAFEAFVKALNGHDYQQLCEHADFDVAIGPKNAEGMWEGVRDSGFAAVTHFFSKFEKKKKEGKVVEPPAVRNWESPLGGHQFDLVGPDAGDLAMMPAPTVGSSELSAELAEVYAMALLRDVSFEAMEGTNTPVCAYAYPTDALVPTVDSILAELQQLTWFNPSKTPDYYLIDKDKPSTHEQRRRKARWHEPPSHKNSVEKTDDEITASKLFRGSVPGAKIGPYISQFLLIGSRNEVDDEQFAETANNAQRQWAKDVRHVQSNAVPSMTVWAEDEPTSGIESGFIVFGSQRIHQQVNTHLAKRDYMTDWPLWLDVQNGADVSGADEYEKELRFIGTPRDLATFVHFDQLYQAYFNACLLLFTNKVPFDFGFPSGRTHATRGSFATFGAPHVLSLMTEVASRALKAVRRQKFQHHLRGRPEQLAAMLTLQANGKDVGFGSMLSELEAPIAASDSDDPPTILQTIADVNCFQNEKVMKDRATNRDDKLYYPRLITEDDLTANEGKEGWAGAAVWDKDCLEIDKDKNYLLPMAFPEGSPMHAAYGAGHATVAGACITVLKAFFEMSLEEPPKPPKDDDAASESEAEMAKGSTEQPLSISTIKENEACWEAASFMKWFNYPFAYVADDKPEGSDSVARTKLKEKTDCPTSKLTIEGELNKLAANISIGRNFAGVHFYTDYYDSLRMGERLAVGLLQEQMATYRDPVSMRLTSFDNDRIIIHGDGCGCTKVEVCPVGSTTWEDAYDEWWDRHATITPA